MLSVGVQNIKPLNLIKFLVKLFSKSLPPNPLQRGLNWVDTVGEARTIPSHIFSWGIVKGQTP